jgi:hypothetical protein
MTAASGKCPACGQGGEETGRAPRRIFWRCPRGHEWSTEIEPIEPIEPVVHRDAHDTEHEWAAGAARRWNEGGLAERVYVLADDPRGVTGYEAAALTDNLGVEWSVRPVLSRLKKAGRVRVTAWRRRNPRGAREVVYVATGRYRGSIHGDPARAYAESRAEEAAV